MKDKTDRLLEAIEHPEFTSVKEINELLEDSEIMQLYNLMSKTATSLIETSDPDVDKEWNCFKRNHSHTLRKKLLRFPTGYPARNIAAAAIFAFATLAMIATTIGVYNSLEQSKRTVPAQTDTANISDSVLTTVQDSVYTPEPTEAPQIVIFRKHSFDDMISTIAHYYGAAVSYRSDRTKNLILYFRWDQSLPLEQITEQINNFEQINIMLIDNALIID